MAVTYADHCFGKVAFERREHAETARRRASRSKGKKRGGRNVYRCQFCRNWHIGNAI